MREPIERYFKVGLVAAMAVPDFGVDAVGCVRKIVQDPYFHAIELNPITDPAQRHAVATLLRQSHMTVCSGAQARLLSAGLNPNDPDEQGRLAAEKVLLEGVEEAVELGAARVAFLAGKWSEATKEMCFAQLCKTTRAVCAYAKTKKIFVELEIFDYDIAKAALIGPASIAAQFAAEIRQSCNNFGLLVDLSHLPMCREDSVYTLRLLRPYITHFHVGNTVVCAPEAEAYGDEHPRFGFPQSENDTPQLLDFLWTMKQEGFFCKNNPYVLSFEVKPQLWEDMDAVLASSKRVLNRAWALLQE